MELELNYKHMRYFYFISTILFMITSCKKPDDRKCVKSVGNNAIKTIPMSDFNKLVLKKGIEYELIQDDSCYLLVNGGKNLINFIEYSEIETKKILIENKNKCNFLRNYSKSKIKVEIHFKEIDEIRYEGTSTLFSTDTLNFNFLKFEVIDACGTVNLILKANTLFADVPFGNGNYNLIGEVKHAELSIKSNGYCNTEKLAVTDYLKVNNESAGDMHILINKLDLNGKIVGSGNIYYKGEIKNNKLKEYSSGKLIKK
jgi:hypothetical protein